MKRLHIKVIDRSYAALLSAKSPAERISMVGDAHQMARILAEAGVRYLHPDWSDLQISAEATKRMMYGAN